MPQTEKEQITMTQLLTPMIFMALTLLILFCFQMSQILHDRDSLNQSISQQEPSIQEAQKINAQFGGLVMGTRRLAEQGNKGAAALVDQLKQIGVIPQDMPRSQAGSPAPVPGASGGVTPPPGMVPMKP